MPGSNEDLAVLGFRIKTAGADAAFRKILDSLGTVEKKFQETDTALEATVTKSMTELGRVVKGVNSAANALQRNKNIFDAFDSLSKFAEGAKNLKIDALAISEALRTLSNAGLASMARRLGDAFSTFERGTKVLEFEMKLANPDFLEKLQKDLLITIEPTTKAALSELKYSLDALAKGVVAKIIPDKESINALKQAVQDGIKPEIKFDENAKGIVANLYSVIRDGIKQQGPILVPLQFSFSQAKSDRPSTNLSDPEKQARDDLRDTLEEYAKDFGGKGGLNAVWDKAILGGPEAIEKIRRVLATRTSWLETAITDSLDKAQLKPSKYGELVEQGLESIPVDVANTVGKIAGQLKGLLKRHQEELTIRPEFGDPTQKDEDIKQKFADFSQRLSNLAGKSLRKVIVPSDKLVIQPKSAVVDTAYLQAAVGVVLATKPVTATADVIIDPFSLKVKTDNLEPGSIKLTRKGLKIDVITFEPEKINFRGLDKISNSLANPIDIKASLNVKPNTVSIDEEALNKLLPLKYAVRPIDVKARIKVIPVAATLDSEATKQIVGTSRSAIKVQSTISLDPLPSDEIQKLDTLVNKLYDVERAYGNIQTIAARLKDTVKELDAAMSEEVKQLIKNGIVASAGSKTGLRATDPLKDIAHMALEATRIANEAEKAQKRQQKEAEKALKAKLKEEKEEAKRLAEAEHISTLWDAINKKGDYSEISEQRMAASREETAAIMENARNLSIVSDLDDKRASEFAQAEESIRIAMDGVTKSMSNQIDEVKDGVKAAKASGEAYRKHVETAGRLRLAFNELNPQVVQFNRQMSQLSHVEKLNIADPFKALKAELGDTNSRLVDIARSFGLYFSGRMIVGYFRQAAESANSFGMEIRRIQSLATNFDFSNLREQLMDIDARFGNVIHNAQALYWAYSSGVRGSEKDLVRFTEVMSKTATTIKSDIMPTVDAATSIMNAWNLSAGSAKEIGDLLFSIIKFGKSNASQLTTSLGHVVAPAASLNLELDELGATIATLTKTMRTNRALTYLSNILGKLASPTEKVKEAAAEFGIELSANAIKARGFAQTLKDIREATGGDVAKIAKLFPDLRGQRAAITLLSTQYADFEKQLGNMRNKAGSMEEALSKIADSPDAQLKALKNTWQMLAIEVGAATNNLLTFGGALTPIMKKINGMEHTGRTITGNLIAAAGAWGGMYLMSRTLQAAQYAMAQSAYQMASATTEVAQNELTIALNKQEAALQDNRMLVSELKTVLAAREYNDVVLNTLKGKQQMLKTDEEHARLELSTAKQRLKLEDTGAQRRLTADMLNIGQSRSRVAALNELRTEFATDGTAKSERNIVNLLRRLQADVVMRRSRVQVGAQGLIDTMMNEIRPLVENQGVFGKQLRDALEKGDAGGYNKFKELIGNVVNTIKSRGEISSALGKYDNQEDILNVLKEQLAVGVLQKNLTSGDVYQHQVILQLLDDQIDKERKALAIMEDKAKSTKLSLNMDSERIAQADAIAEQEAYVAELTRSRVELEVMIKNRSDALTGSLKNQIGLLDAAAKLAKDRLDHDTRDVETLKANAQLMLKQASMLGRETLSATQEYVKAQMEYHSLSMEQQAIETQIKQLVDAENKLIVDTAENQAKYNKLLSEKAVLEERSVAAASKMLKLGAMAGDAKSRDTIIANYLGTDDQLIKEIARKKGVVSEAMRKMSSEVGKSVFGGRLGGRGLQSLSMLSSFVPGLGRWGMAASMAGSLNVVGNTAKGITWLTGSMMGLLGTTEKLKKKGILSMKTGLEDLTKVIMQGSAWLPKFALAEKQLMALRKAGASRQALANFATTATWMTAGIGTAVIGAIAAGLWYALSKTEKGGPFGEVMEKFYGVDDKERYGRYLGIRLEQLQNERMTNAEMQRETKRMIEIAEQQNKDKQHQLELTRKYYELTSTLHKLETINSVQKLKNEIDAISDTILEYRKAQKEIQSIIDTAGSRMDDTQRKGYETQISELNAKIAEERAKRGRAIRAYRKQEKVLWQGYADASYNSLMELLESDRDSAFAPLLDGKRKLELAEKSVVMARQRLATVLSKDTSTEIKDIMNMPSEAINDLIRQQIKSASDALKLAQKNLDNARKTAENGETEAIRKEAQDKISDLEQAETNAQSKLDKIMADIRAVMNDIYSRSITRADALVEETMDRIKQNGLDLKIANLRQNVDLTFMSVSNNIHILNEEITKLIDNYVNQVGIFSVIDDVLRERIFKGELKKMFESRVDQRATRVGMLKSGMESVANFLESIASETQNLEKSLFEFRMSNRAYANMRPSLIKQRMEMLSNVLSGDRGIYSLIDNAMDTVGKRFAVNDFAGAAKALEDAKKYGAQARGIEEEKLDLIKKQADIEREINGSMYQLANTLRGQFAATTQQAVSADSVEALKLMSRSFGESIAPPMSDTYQERERQYREQRMAQDREFYTALTNAAVALQIRLGEEANRAQMNDGAAKTMEDAAIKANTAADTFSKTVESSKTLLRVRRI